MERESIVARDFMGLNSHNRTEMEVDSKGCLDCGGNKILTLGLLKDRENNCPGSGLQLSSGFDTNRQCNSRVGKQSGGGDGSGGVPFKLGSLLNSTGSRRNVVKGVNVNGSVGEEHGFAGKAYFPAHNAEIQRSLLRFAAASSVTKEGRQYASEKSQTHDRERVAAAGKVSDGQTESDIQQREEFGQCLKDKVPVPNMALQWSCWNKAAMLQQFMSFKNLQEERPEKRKFDELATSGFHPLVTAGAFKSNQRSTGVTQKAFDLDATSRDTVESGNYYSGANGPSNRQFVGSSTPFPIRALEDISHSDPSIRETGAFPSPNLSLSASNFKEHLGSFISLKGQQGTATSCIGSTPLLRPLSSISFTSQPSVLHCATGSLVNSTVSRAISNDPAKSDSAQLTIFYAGTVNVYDDVPQEKAHSIMLLASSGSSLSVKMGDSPPQRFATSIPVTTSGHNSPATATVCSSLPSALPLISPQVISQKPQATSIPFSQPTLVSSTNKESQTYQNGTGTASNQQETPKRSASGSNSSALVPRALPQARKASLTRFLEKRKERVHSNVPYSTDHSPDHSSSQREMSTLSFDGCPASQHDLTHGNALDDKDKTKSEGTALFLNMDHEEQSWPLKAENKSEERKTALEIRNC